MPIVSIERQGAANVAAFVEGDARVNHSLFDTTGAEEILACMMAIKVVADRAPPYQTTGFFIQGDHFEHRSSLRTLFPSATATPSEFGIPWPGGDPGPMPTPLERRGCCLEFPDGVASSLHVQCVDLGACGEEQRIPVFHNGGHARSGSVVVNLSTIQAAPRVLYGFSIDLC